jgi:hypothetical protein
VKVGQLTLILGQIRELYVAAGASGPAKDLKTLSDALTVHSENSVEAFVAETRRRLSEPPRKSKGRKKAGAAAAPLNEGAITSYVAQLNNAGTDRRAFDAVFERLTADKLLRVGELTEIAHRYSGGAAAFKSAAAARSDIAKAFVRQARFANKLL